MSSRLRSSGLGLVAGSIMLRAVMGSGAPNGAQEPRILDLDGRFVDPFRSTDARAVVLVFTSSDCPISNRYAPELRKRSRPAT